MMSSPSTLATFTYESILDRQVDLNGRRVFLIANNTVARFEEDPDRFEVRYYGMHIVTLGPDGSVTLWDKGLRHSHTTKDRINRALAPIGLVVHAIGGSWIVFRKDGHGDAHRVADFRDGISFDREGNVQ